MARPPLTLHVVEAAATEPTVDATPAGPLALRVLPRPRRLAVTTRAERGHAVPVRYRERLEAGARAPRGLPLVELAAVAGPDRVAVGDEDGAPTAREYWQCLTDNGDLVLLYRDLMEAPNAHAGAEADAPAPDPGVAGAAAPAAWFLQGWWD